MFSKTYTPKIDFDFVKIAAQGTVILRATKSIILPSSKAPQSFARKKKDWDISCIVVVAIIVSYLLLEMLGTRSSVSD